MGDESRIAAADVDFWAGKFGIGMLIVSRTGS